MDKIVGKYGNKGVISNFRDDSFFPHLLGSIYIQDTIINIVNLTTRNITILNDTYTPIAEIPASENPCYTTEYDRWNCLNIDDIIIDVFNSDCAGIIGLPDPVYGTIYIVSLRVAKAIQMQLPDRKDVYTVTEAVYDKDDHLIGYRGLIRI